MQILRNLSVIGLMICLSACETAIPKNVDSSTPIFIPTAAFSTPTVDMIKPVAAQTMLANVTPTYEVVVTQTPTLLSLSATATLTRILPAGPTATFDTLRKTPPTLMLHRSNPDFDSVAFLKDFVRILQDKHMLVVTYQDLTRLPDLTALEPNRLVIITIDDVSLQAPIDPTIQQMIAILREAKYPAVLGIVTEGKLPDLKTAAQLKTLAGEGWELAMHTDSHTDLHVLEQTSPYGARLEIRTCAEKINQATGVQPMTLVLPYGNMVEDLKILYRENVRWAVGITGGEKYRTTNHVYYVGRDGPAGDAQNTFKVIMDRFNRQ